VPQLTEAAKKRVAQRLKELVAKCSTEATTSHHDIGATIHEVPEVPFSQPRGKLTLRFGEAGFALLKEDVVKFSAAWRGVGPILEAPSAETQAVDSQKTAATLVVVTTEAASYKKGVVCVNLASLKNAGVSFPARLLSGGGGGGGGAVVVGSSPPPLLLCRRPSYLFFYSRSQPSLRSFIHSLILPSSTNKQTKNNYSLDRRRTTAERSSDRLVVTLPPTAYVLLLLPTVVDGWMDERGEESSVVVSALLTYLLKESQRRGRRRRLRGRRRRPPSARSRRSPRFAVPPGTRLRRGPRP